MSPVAAYESKAYSESVWAELSDTTLLAAWKDVFSDTLPACEDTLKLLFCLFPSFLRL